MLTDVASEPGDSHYKAGEITTRLTKTQAMVTPNVRFVSPLEPPLQMKVHNYKQQKNNQTTKHTHTQTKKQTHKETNKHTNTHTHTHIQRILEN